MGGTTNGGYTGVQIRGNGDVRVRLKIEGKWGWYTAHGYKATPAGLKQAFALRNKVMVLQEAGSTIDWSEYFPGSPMARQQLETAETVPYLNEVADLYFRDAFPGGNSNSTLAVYQRLYNQYWKDSVGRQLVDDVTAEMILDAVDKSDNTSNSTFNNARIVLDNVFKRPEARRWRTSNPMEDVPPRKHVKQPGRALDQAEREAVLLQIEADHPEWLSYFRFAFGTGMRPAEIMGLRWENVNYKEKTLAVEEQRIKGKQTRKLKTDNSRRVLPIVGLTRKALATQLSVTRMRGTDGNVFINPSSSNAIYDLQPMQKIWKKVTTKLGIKRTVPYSTRHTFATLALRDGIQVKRVSEWLGHKSTQMTLDVYTHALDSDLHADIQILGQSYS